MKRRNIWEPRNDGFESLREALYMAFSEGACSQDDAERWLDEYVALTGVFNAAQEALKIRDCVMANRHTEWGTIALKHLDTAIEWLRSALALVDAVRAREGDKRV